MKYIDERSKKNCEAEVKVGDFILANGDLRVICERYENDETIYNTVYLTGTSPCKGFGLVSHSIEELVEFYKKNYDDFELIKSDEIKLVRGK